MSTTTTTTDQSCAVCSKPCTTECAQCKCISYCSRECQKKHWKEHKDRCFPPDSTCTRCLEPISLENPTMCCVQHPDYCLEDRGSTHSSGSTELRRHCQACQQTFCMSRKGDKGQWTYEPTQCQWCYHGRHTIKRLKDDRRRVGKRAETILVDEDDTTRSIQGKLNAINAEKVRILVIKKAEGSYYDEAIRPTLDLKMPKLEELQLLDVAFQNISLTPRTCPKLYFLEMQNIPDDCHVEIDCPLLQEVDVRHHHGDCKWVDTMLHVATNLQIFKSYKLGVGEISFAGSELKEIHLHRSDCLENVTIWAPRLKHLRMQGCYSLENLTFPDQRPAHLGSADNENTLQQPTPFKVETTNSCLSPGIIQTLKNHPRITWERDEDEDEEQMTGSLEADMFRMFSQPDQRDNIMSGLNFQF